MTIDTRSTTALETTLTHVVATDGASVQLLVHRPPEPNGWLVWAHGGSWQHGSALGWAPITQALASASGWAVVSVDYRLAPAHRFPAAILDVLAALNWAETEAGDLLVVVGGDSAGGTIATLAALRRRDAGGRVPPQLLAYPPLDPDCARASYRAVPGAFPSRTDLAAAWRLWLGPEALGDPTSVTPLAASSLARLAPVALIVGEHDPVRDDVTAYADGLDADSVPVTVGMLPGVGHADLLSRQNRVLPALVAALSRPPLSEPSVSTHRPHHLEGTLS